MSFHLRLAPLLRTCAWLAGVLWVVTVGVEALAQYRTGAFPSVPALIRVMALPLGLGALLALVDLVVVLAYPVRVLPEGLRGFNAWGAYKTVKWGDIPSVSPASLLRMRYLRVPVPASTWPMTVPLALRDLPGFLAAIEQHAGPEHPLAAAVRLALQARSEAPVATATAADPKVEP
ncbi:hypothetical protein DES44_0099 [Roseateles depolymerans]|uniref:Uncharacterized protein n=2 Tax=Roseateles depolymerans TaxID=76731 RepID=A0A0U3MMT0_9BURK|nr:hypothetical protein [Roseateles depolymerans]ALV08780.1 hypothetical protein RD2015_4337 [Roseateles depolymerans]REG20990.1 hypothetical protein DES44_0099 [Roseateles depolymerans]